MPTWLIILLVAGPALGLIYCLANWNAGRDCRYCRIALIVVGEVTGVWLLFNGWSESSERQVAFGTVILLTLNFVFGIRYLAQWLGQWNTRRATRSEHTALAMALTGATAAAVAEDESRAARQSGADSDTQSTSESGDLDLDVDL